MQCSKEAVQCRTGRSEQVCLESSDLLHAHLALAGKRFNYCCYYLLLFTITYYYYYNYCYYYYHCFYY